MYLADEPGHHEATALVADPDVALVTGTWTVIEVSGALVRAARAGRGDQSRLLRLLDADLAPGGPITPISVPQDRVEHEALRLVRSLGLRAMDAWHLAVAVLAVPSLAEPGETTAFATRDENQAMAADALGFSRL